MRFYTGQHQHYCGIDLHARTLYLCVQDREGNILLHKNLPCDRARLLEAIKPFRDDLVVASECIFNWYWLADLCAEHSIPFVLGHALYMKAIHGAKAKNDRIDSLKTASLLRGGLLPQAYAYPAKMRPTRDLLRRRLHRRCGDRHDTARPQGAHRQAPGRLSGQREPRAADAAVGHPDVRADLTERAAARRPP